MDITVELTERPIRPGSPSTAPGTVGAWVEFSGIVRGEEDGEAIAALDYEAYDSMARRVMRELLEVLGAKHGCTQAHVIHRTGIIPVGETAIWVGVGAAHRKEAFACVTEFMDRLKQDVPVWKRQAIGGQAASHEPA